MATWQWQQLVGRNEQHDTQYEQLALQLAIAAAADHHAAANTTRHAATANDGTHAVATTSATTSNSYDCSDSS